MKYLKKICRCKAVDYVHNHEGVRVKVKTRKDPKVDKTEGSGTRNSFWAFLAKMMIGEALRWSIRNWPFICEKASASFEVIMEMLKL
jgi:hypothetical protein